LKCYERKYHLIDAKLKTEPKSQTNKIKNSSFTLKYLISTFLNISLYNFKPLTWHLTRDIVMNMKVKECKVKYLNGNASSVHI